VRTRLEVFGPHREAMRRATAARLLPSNGLAACGSLWRTVDLMWSAAGDDARDASYYTKRSLLAAVWTGTFLFWLEDRSESYAETWSFLERRIANVMQIGRLRARLDDFLDGFGRLNPMAQRR
jgi:ubiquinone biosynthesis protein COQ9